MQWRVWNPNDLEKSKHWPLDGSVYLLNGNSYATG